MYDKEYLLPLTAGILFAIYMFRPFERKTIEKEPETAEKKLETAEKKQDEEIPFPEPNSPIDYGFVLKEYRNLYKN